jgi:RNA polymerase sigma factor (sigma-70 family)
MLNSETIELTYPEFEAFRLSDLEKLTQEEIAKRMNTSRGTVWRLLESAREKIARALIESRPIIISPKGEIEKVE